MFKSKMKTKRLLFRTIEVTDLEIKTKWINNPEVNKALFFTLPVSLNETIKWYENIVKNPTREDFIIIEKETDKRIGFGGYTNIDWINKKAEPNIAIGEVAAWGKGYGTEGLHLLLDYAFNVMGLNRMYGYVVEFNKAAIKMDLKAGFNNEGLLIEDVFLNGKFHNRIFMGVTKKQFNNKFHY